MNSESTAWRHELVPVSICVCVGVMMALLPSLLWWPRVGEPICIGDADEVFYMALGSQAYFNHPTYLSDPSLVSGGISIYSNLPILPGVLISRMLGLGVVGIELAWRVVAGASIALAWYILARGYMKSRWVIMVIVAMLLADGGILGSSLVVKQLVTFAKVMTGPQGAMFDYKPDIHREWRISTPALTMAYLLFHLWLVTRARKLATPQSIVLSGLSFGVLFYVYPYYWTAAGAALLLALALDAGHRRVYFWTGCLGGLVGLPHVVADLMVKQSTSPDWLIRSGKLVSRPHLSDVGVPTIGLIVALIGLWWVWTRRRDLTYIWTLGISGLALYLNHIVTGMDIENYHWNYVWGPCFSFLLVLMGESLLPQSGRWARPAFVLLLGLGIVGVSTGVTLRIAESLRNARIRELTMKYHRFREQMLVRDSVRLVPGAVVAGDEIFVDYSAIFNNTRPLDNYWIFLSPSITDVDWNRRKALNAYLISPSATEDELKKNLLSGPNWTRIGAEADEEKRRSDRFAVYRSMASELDSTLDHYAVRYFAIPADQPAPADFERRWVCLQKGPFWQIWERPRPSGWRNRAPTADVSSR